jgi:hypothetical protein
MELVLRRCNERIALRRTARRVPDQLTLILEQIVTGRELPKPELLVINRTSGRFGKSLASSGVML